MEAIDEFHETYNFTVQGWRIKTQGYFYGGKFVDEGLWLKDFTRWFTVRENAKENKKERKSTNARVCVEEKFIVSLLL